MVDSRLPELREQLQEVNELIYSALVAREQIVDQVFRIKDEMGLDRFDSRREAEMFQQLRRRWQEDKAQGKSLPSWSSIERIFKRIFQEALHHEIAKS
jgi:chorismate mutase